jgi:hypothetical protein
MQHSIVERAEFPAKTKHFRWYGPMGQIFLYFKRPTLHDGGVVEKKHQISKQIISTQCGAQIGPHRTMDGVQKKGIGGDKENIQLR